MLLASSLDILFCILQYLTVRDALALFATCKRLRESDSRTFWVFVNEGLDKFPHAPGRTAIHYQTSSTDALRTRAIRTSRIHKAWRTIHQAPRIARSISIPSRYNIHQLVPVPWTRFIVLLDLDYLLVQDWISGHTNRVLLPDCVHRLLSVRVFWVEALASHIIVTHLTTSSSGTASYTDKLHLFKLDIETGSVSPLVDIVAPPGLVHLDLRGNDLAMLSDDRHSVRIFIFEIVSSPEISMSPRTILEIVTMSPPAQSSFLILSQNRFLVASCTGIAIYEIPPEVLELRPRLWSTPPLWQRALDRPRTAPFHQLGPLLNSSDGTASLTILNGRYIQFLIVPATTSDFQITHAHTFSPFPNTVLGTGVGAYSLPSTLTFATLGVSHGLETSLPLSYRPDDTDRFTGAILQDDGVVHQFLNIDEGQGLVIFLTPALPGRLAAVNVLEII